MAFDGGIDGPIEARALSAARDRRRLLRTEGYRMYAGDPERLLRRRRSDGPRLIVTPNLDHLRLLDDLRSLRRAYAAADVVVNDSRFLQRAFLGGRALCYPGSEFVPDLLSRVRPGAAVLVIGASERLRRWVGEAFPALAVEIVEPSRGFVLRRGERRALVERARALRPELILVCTGAPQSELLAMQLKRALVHGCDIVCCGGALQFMAGEKRRAPPWMRGVGVEWAFRFLEEPRTRGRYLADARFLVRALPALLSLRGGGPARFARFTLELAPRG